VVSGSGVVTVHGADGRGMVQYPWTGLSGNAVGIG
jgi:hypothetical protein